ncbi:hypothetical protein L208DRAFT_671726 [Tricholoma matsutake]|nr:hypothetical protein L208DRAFT_671726 [Tricholoma matsutake 945]
MEKSIRSTLQSFQDAMLKKSSSPLSMLHEISHHSGEQLSEPSRFTSLKTRVFRSRDALSASNLVKLQEDASPMERFSWPQHCH